MRLPDQVRIAEQLLPELGPWRAHRPPHETDGVSTCTLDEVKVIIEGLSEDPDEWVKVDFCRSLHVIEAAMAQCQLRTFLAERLPGKLDPEHRAYLKRRASQHP